MLSSQVFSTSVTVVKPVGFHLATAVIQVIINVGHCKGTPVEIVLSADTVVAANRVVEARSPTLKRRTASAVSE
jgi:hypothetical protein